MEFPFCGRLEFHNPMELRAVVQSLSFKSSFGSCHFGAAEVGRGAPRRVCFPVCQLKSVAELTPKELHHRRKKEEWKRLRRARRLEKLAEKAREQEREASLRQPRRREGLCSFEKYKLAKESGGGVQVEEWKSGVKGKTTLLSKFEEEFAVRVREAVSSIKPVTATASEHSDGQSSTRFREDSHSVSEGEAEDASDDWLLAYGLRSNGDLGPHSERIADDEGLDRKLTVSGSDSILPVEGNDCRSIGVADAGNERDEGAADAVIVTDAHDELLRTDGGTRDIASAVLSEDERVAHPSSRSQLRFIDHSFGDRAPAGGRIASSGSYNNVVGMDGRDKSHAGTGSREGDSLGMLEPRDWRVNPKTPRRKDREVGRRIIDRRKGEPLSTLLDERSAGITAETRGLLEALHEDVTGEVWRKPVDEREQLEWLVQEYVSDLTFAFPTPALKRMRVRLRDCDGFERGML